MFLQLLPDGSAGQKPALFESFSPDSNDCGFDDSFESVVEMSDSEDDDVSVTAEVTSTTPPSTNTVYYRCDKCSYQTRIKHLLDRHVAKHALGCPEMVDCSMCEFSSNYVNSMKHHIEVFHTKIHRCEECDKVMTKHMLLKHVERVHGKECQDQKEIHPSNNAGLNESTSCTSTQNRSPEAPDVEIKTEPTEFLESNCVSQNHAMETPASGNDNSVPGSFEVDNQLRCSICAFTTQNQLSLKYHAVVFHKKTVKCDHCSLVLTKHELIMHVVKEHAVAEHVSSQGQVTSPGLETRRPDTDGSGPPLAHDVPEHSTTKEFKCSHCLYSAARGSILDDHLSAFHTKKYHCNQCPVIMTKHEVIEHCQVVHGKTLPGNCRLKAAIKHGERVIGEVSSENQEKEISDCDDDDGLVIESTSCTSTQNGSPEFPDVEIKNEPTEFLESECVSPDLARKTHESESDNSFSRTDEVDTQLRCSICPFTTQNQPSLKYHVIVFHKKKLKCDHCSLVLTRHDLIQHVAKDHAKPGTSLGPEHLLPKDTQSEKTDTDKSGPPLAQDVPEHNATKEFKCSHCSFSTARSSSLDDHVFSFHTKKYHCNQCPAIMTKHEVVEHCQVVHGKTIKVKGRWYLKAASQDLKTVAVPPMSGRSEDDSTLAAAQVQNESKQATTNCPFCDYASPKIMDVEGHISRMHTMKYSCMYCSEIMTKHEIIIHSKEIHGVRVSKSRSFQKVRSGSDVSTNDVRNPRLLKRSSRKFACSLCKFSSLSAVGLYEHSERFHKRNPKKRYGMVIKNAGVSKNKPVRQPPKKLRRQVGLTVHNAASSNVSSKTELHPQNTIGGPAPLVAEAGAEEITAVTVASEVKDQTSLDCSCCDFKTPWLRNLKNHKVLFHKRIYKCDYCVAKMTKYELIKHAKEKHGVVMKFLMKIAPSDSKIVPRSKLKKSPRGSGHQIPTPSSDSSSIDVNVLDHHGEKICPICNFPFHPGAIERHMIRFHSDDPEKHSRKVHGVILKTPGGRGENIGGTIHNVKVEEGIDVLETSTQEEIANSPSGELALHSSKKLTKSTDLFAIPSQEAKNPLPGVVRLNDRDKIAAGDAETIIQNAPITSTSEPEVSPLKNKINAPKPCAPKLHVHDCYIIKPIPIPVVKQNKGQENRPTLDISMQEIASSEHKYQPPVAGSNYKSKSQSRLFKCHDCSYKTRIKSLMRRHAKLHLPEGQFVCTNCDFKHSKSLYFAKHLTSHDLPGAAMKCCFCDFTTPLLGSMRQHLGIHRPVGSFYCSKCEFSCSQFNSLSFHYKSHHFGKYACPLCPKVATKYILSHHFEKCHPKFNLKDLGGFRATSQHTRMRKSSSENAQKKIAAQAFRKKISRQELKCKTCEFQTLRRDLLQRHEAKHSLLECPVCDMKFSKGYAFTVHLSQHNPQEVPFKCFYCGDLSDHMGDLYRHLSFHLSALKTHDCALCEFSSLRRDYLKFHMSTHSKKHTMLKSKAPSLKIDFSGGTDQGKPAVESKTPRPSDDGGSGSFAGPSKHAYKQSTPSQNTLSMRDPRLSKPDKNLKNPDIRRAFLEGQPTDSITRLPDSALHHPSADSATKTDNVKCIPIQCLQSMSDRTHPKKDMIAKYHSRLNFEWTTTAATDSKTSASPAAPMKTDTHSTYSAFATPQMYKPTGSLNNPKPPKTSATETCISVRVDYSDDQFRVPAAGSSEPSNNCSKDSEIPAPSKHQCPNCAFWTKKKDLYERHIIKHKPLICPVCCSTIFDHSQFTAHVVLHNPPNMPNKCYACGIVTENQDMLFRHLALKHIDALAKFDCVFCDYSSVEAEPLTSHIANVHWFSKNHEVPTYFNDSKPVPQTSTPVAQTSTPVSHPSKLVLETSRPVSLTSKPISQTSKSILQTSAPASQTSAPDPKRGDKPGEQFDNMSWSHKSLGNLTLVRLGEMPGVSRSMEPKQFIQNKVTAALGADPTTTSSSNAKSVPGFNRSTPGSIFISDASRKSSGVALLPTGPQFNARSTSHLPSANLRTVDNAKKLWIPEPCRPDDPKWLAVAKYGHSSSPSKDVLTSTFTDNDTSKIAENPPKNIPQNPPGDCK